MAKRPKVYYPKAFIKEGLYTNGKELMYESGREYTGPYHSYTDGFSITGATYSEKTSERLIPYVDIKSQSKGNFVYDIIKEIEDITKYEVPKSFFPKPTADDYAIGVITWYIVKKRNEAIGRLFEITKEQYKTLSQEGKGINGNLYKGIEIKWKINGNAVDIIKNGITIPSITSTNKRTLFFKESSFKGITKFLGDFEEFSIYRPIKSI